MSNNYIVVGRLLKDYQMQHDPLLPSYTRTECARCGEALIFSKEGGEVLARPGAYPLCLQCNYDTMPENVEFRVTGHAAEILNRDDEKGRQAREIMAKLLARGLNT